MYEILYQDRVVYRTGNAGDALAEIERLTGEFPGRAYCLRQVVS